MAGASAYYIHHTHPSGLTKYNRMILNSVETVYIRFKHIKRTFLGEPYTKCVFSSFTGHGSNPYTEHACLEAVLTHTLCDICQCYPSYITGMVRAAQLNGNANCRKRS